MTNKCYTLIFLLLLPILSIAQFRVVKQEALPVSSDYRIIPDVEGNVLVSDDFLSGPGNPKNADSVTVYQFWPQEKTGGNERGGVYANLDDDPDFEVVYCIGLKAYAWNLNAFMVPGWPVDLDYPADGAPSFGDIDGDGFGEIVISTHQPGSANTGSLYAFKKNGTNAYGFPVTLNGGAIKTPVLADIDNNGTMEIIVAVRQWPDGFIYIFNGDGTVYPNWPQRMDYVPASEPAVGDITGDSIPEIIAESYYGIQAYRLDGTQLPGFPFTPGNDRVFSYSAPVLADLDEDGFREIVCGDHGLSAGDGRVYVLKNDGTFLPGWPKITTYWIYGPPSVADIDGDGTLDVTVGDQLLSQTPINKVYAWNAITSEPLPGFPIENIYAVNNQIIIADLDGDDMLELMFDDNTSAGIYLGYNHDGTPMEGWPIHVIGTTFYINPFVVDLNGDGVSDISGGGYQPDDDNTFIYIWNAGTPQHNELAVLPVFQYNTRHNGVYGDNLMVGMKENPGMEGSPSGFTISPNPARDQVMVNYNLGKAGSFNFTLYSCSGAKIWESGEMSGNSGPGTLEIDLPKDQPGTYFCKMVTPAGITVQKLLVIQ